MKKKKTRLLPIKKMRLSASLKDLYREMRDRGIIVTDELKRELMHHIDEITRHPVLCPDCMPPGGQITLGAWAASLGIGGADWKTDYQLYSEIYEFLAIELVETVRDELRLLGINRSFSI